MSRLTVIDQAIALSRTLLQCVETEDWERFVELEQSRRSLIEQINTENTPASESTVTTDKLTELLRLNEQIQQYCVQQRELAIGKIQELNQGNKAIQAYRQT